jgi:hypothetical protein
LWSHIIKPERSDETCSKALFESKPPMHRKCCVLKKADSGLNREISLHYPKPVFHALVKPM